jgi:hypothetical protein
MVRKLFILGGVALAFATFAIVGCNNQPASEQSPAALSIPQPGEHKISPANTDADHAHKPGAHGGIIVPLGRDSYHIEAVFAKDGVIRLYTLGKDEARVQEIESQELVGYATPRGAPEAVQVKFTPEPQKGDTHGKTSLFVCQLPAELRGKTLEVTINNIQISGERFRVGFSNERTSHDEGVGSSMIPEKARALYLMPGGKYTVEDIQANGNTTPQQKYRGMESTHDAKPQPGDRICPISMSKSNPKFTWVVGGKTYEFCCVPCMDEFVRIAKTKPEEIKDPSEYIKK